MDDVFKLQNVSHRKYIIDYYGMDTILAGLESTVIDSDVINGNAYELLEVIIPFSNGEDGEGDQNTSKSILCCLKYRKKTCGLQ